MAEELRIAALDGSGTFSAYCARPTAPAKAAIIVVQEIFGVNAGIRRKTDDWAEQGYLAVAPDMFWRFAPGYDVDPDVPEQMAQAFTVRERFDPDLGVQDITATIRSVRSMIGGGKVGIVGFCMGGRIAYLTAARTDVDASVGYYGARIDQSLEEGRVIARPLLLHFADEDGFIPPVALDRIHAALDGNPQVSICRHAGVDHGFADTFGKRRNEMRAREADAETRAFFAAHLA